MNAELKAHLDRLDGGCTRSGDEIKRLARRSGYGLETLRSMYYGRRTPSDEVRNRKLRRAMAEKKATPDAPAGVTVL